MKEKILKSKNIILAMTVWCSLLFANFSSAYVEVNWRDELEYLGEDTDLPDASIMEIIVGILNFLLIIIGIVGVIGFIISGILYLTSAGNDKKVEKAKGAMVACIIGVIVGLSGYVALQFADDLLNAWL